MKRILHRTLMTIFLVFVVGFAFWGWNLTRSDGKSGTLETITIGYQAGDPVDVARIHGDFKRKMKAKGYKIVFKEFQNGAAEMEAMSSGTIDYARVGDTPPVSAISQGHKVTLVAAGSSKANGSGIVVGKNSGITSLKQLKGKTIAYTSNTSSQYMVLKAIKKAGLSTSDVKLKDMSQSAASVAFAKGKIDAWANWDPYTAQAEINYGARMLVNGQQLNVNNRDYLISSAYAQEHTDVNKLVVKYLGQDMTWANNHKSKLITLMVKALKLKRSIVAKMVNRRSYAMGSVTKSEIKEEQSIANLFYEQGVTKKQITIKKVNNSN
ncbi:aliphatic sulfonate ABC transporter substrate-binding protein [Lacticaseibacillus thailandensis]|uniref:Putative aliphatic sulfonates-binding protein n=1 Tax=Lacticaseibacillus thailandensis DSM 22698 = JCM 13996 TaxID=1423810 RepID=A0A0R2C673_9LACO|nr:aliphatic sulfonate ABC transporter substrate-binding protein [Lacticaseibacillus thailandensis]KRM86677.1 ABC-type nitrate sulfonate bicarbonate transport system, periplasmic component [Lacticaseibacillus thailandensis DSM 22698 = JCM 13996]